MSCSKRTSTVSLSQRLSRPAAVALALAVSGCSADVTRFDNSGLGLTEGEPQAGRQNTPSGYRPYGAQDQQQPNQPQPYMSGQPRAGLTGESTLDPPDRTAALPQGGGVTARPYGTATPQTDRRAQMPAARTIAPGETIEVQQGDTIYGLARRHNVAVSALIEVNKLGSNSTIKPGQKLVLPQGANPQGESASHRPAAPRIPVAKQQAPRPAQAAQAAQPVQGWEGSYTLKQGESLYAIARQHHVSLDELQRANNITEPTKVRAGTVLHVPLRTREQAADGAAQPQRQQPQRLANEPTADQTPALGTPSVTPRVLNSQDEQPQQQAQPQRRASLEQRTSDAEPGGVEAVPQVRFRWPARGRVIATFGRRPDGTQNDGVNVSVPMGTDIQAAEGGRVAYAGNDIPAYGNLVLIRHDNGWVTAYAHADKILVQREDVVRRGQVIAKSGRTGTVDQPQVHFELRQGAKPVDPLPFMER